MKYFEEFEEFDVFNEVDDFVSIEKPIWKPIKGFSDYEVSPFGDVISLKTGKILIPVINSATGYYSVNLYQDGQPVVKLVHRLVAEAWCPNKNNYEVVDHIDTNKLNNCAENLRWVTTKENINNPLTLEHMKSGQQKRRKK